MIASLSAPHGTDREGVGLAGHAGRMALFVLYCAARCTFPVCMLAWVILSTLFTNSIFTYKYFPSLVTTVWTTYSAYFLMCCMGMVIYAVTYKGFWLYVDRWVILCVCYAASALFSLGMNAEFLRTALSLNNFQHMFYPLVLGIIFVQIYKKKNIESIMRVFMIFAVMNIAISLVEIAVNRNTITISHVAGFFTDRNLLARFLSVVHSWALIVLLTGASRTVRGRLIFLEAGIFICVTMLMSRSGYMMYGLSTLFVMIMSGNRTVRRMMPLAVFLILCVFSAMYLKRMHLDRFDLRPSSDIGRVGTILAGKNMIQHSPVYGIGFGLAQQRYQEFQDIRFPGLRNLRTIHNIYVNIWAEQGIIGLGVFCVLNGGLLLALWRRMRKRPMALRQHEYFCFTALGIFLFHGLMYHTFDYEGVYWIVVALSIIVLRDRPDDLLSPPNNGVAKNNGLATPTLT